jgi:nucleoside-diphosphate-sugar epimerase
MFTLVAGAGYTGRRVLARLPNDEAAGLSRSLGFDADTGDPLPVPLPNRYAVLYTIPPGGDGDQRLQRFLALLSPAPKRFVYISTTGVYGNCRGGVVTEDSPLNPTTRLSKPRVAAESLLENWADETGCSLVILRVPGIYGPGRLGLERIASGAAMLTEADANPGNRIHVDDLVDCCLAALETDTPPGVYNVGDGDTRSATWFSGEVARQAGLPTPPQVSRQQAEREFSPMRLAFLSESRIVDTTKMRKVLGVTPRYADAADGICASL